MSIFSEKKFEEIVTKEEDAIILTEGIELNEDEKALLRLHTKFSIIQTLEESGFQFEQELGYAKIQMERRADLE